MGMVQISDNFEISEEEIEDKLLFVVLKFQSIGYEIIYLKLR